MRMKCYASGRSIKNTNTASLGNEDIAFYVSYVTAPVKRTRKGWERFILETHLTTFTLFHPHQRAKHETDFSELKVDMNGKELPVL